MTPARALPAPRRQPDPDGGRLAVSRQRRLQPGRGAARRHDRAPRPSRGPDRASRISSVARSANGVDGWTIDPEPLLAPADGVESEQWGFEDARVVFVPELDRWVITCTAYGPAGPAVYLATTEDFRSVERHGIVRQPEDKNAALLPERIDGKWVLFHRPRTEYGPLTRRDPALSVRGPRQLERAGAGAAAAGGRLVGLAPDRHRPAAAANRARLAADLPRRQGDASPAASTGSASRSRTSTSRRGVLHRLPEWILGPSAPYEREGDVPERRLPVRARPRRRRPTRSGSTTGPPTRRSASPRRGSGTCSQPSWPRRG